VRHGGSVTRVLMFTGTGNLAIVHKIQVMHQLIKVETYSHCGIEECARLDSLLRAK